MDATVPALRLVHDDDCASVPVAHVQGFGLCADGMTRQLLVTLADGRTWCCSLRPGLPIEHGIVQA